MARVRDIARANWIKPLLGKTAPNVQELYRSNAPQSDELLATKVTVGGKTHILRPPENVTPEEQAWRDKFRYDIGGTPAPKGSEKYATGSGGNIDPSTPGSMLAEAAMKGGQVGEQPKPEDLQHAPIGNKGDGSGEHWVTLNGNHVLMPD